MKALDAIVVGGGHNGLTTACLLAKHGRKVVVLERRSVLGGLAAADEFHPGYRSAGALHDTIGVRRHVIEALELGRHGLKMARHRPDLLVLSEDAAPLEIPGDLQVAARALAERSPRDGEAYARYQARFERWRPALQAAIDAGPVDPINLESNDFFALARTALRVRRLGKKDMLELLRLPPMCVADALNEWFETDALKAALALPAVACAFTGPWSPGSNANLLLRELTAGPGVAADGATLIEALERCASSLGVEARLGVEVRRIVIERGRVRGVELSGGEVVEAPVVACSCDPKQALLELVPTGTLDLEVEERVRTFRTRGGTAHVLLALDGPLAFARAEQPVIHACTGSSLDTLERAFDPLKYRRLAERPALEIHVPTVARPDLAPNGGHVISILAHGAPYDLDGGWDDGARTRLGDAVVSVLERHAPGAGARIVHRQVSAPPDLEARYRLSGGHLHHGEHTLDQLLVRPVPEALDYATPIAGLFLCGSGSYPGGGLTCAPGALAARAMLRRSRSEVAAVG